MSRNGFAGNGVVGNGASIVSAKNDEQEGWEIQESDELSAEREKKRYVRTINKKYIGLKRKILI